MYSTYYFYQPEERWYQPTFNKNQKCRDDRRPQNGRLVSPGGSPSHLDRYSTAPRFTYNNSQKKWAPNKNHNANGRFHRNSPQSNFRDTSNPQAKTGEPKVSKKTIKPKPQKQQQQSDLRVLERDESEKSGSRGSFNDEPKNRSPNRNGNNGNRVRVRQFYSSNFKHLSGYSPKKWAEANDPPESVAPECQVQHTSTWPRGATRGALDLYPPHCGKTTPMCRCMNVVQSLVVTEPPQSLTNGSEWDQVSLGIWSKFVEKQQCEPVLKAKIELWEVVYKIIKEAYPKCGIYLVGSTLSGFGMDESDIDLCFMLHHLPVDQRSEAQGHLNTLGHLVMSSIRYLPVQGLRVIKAKVPLLSFKEARTGFNFDINCNNSVGIRNTFLLYHYARIEWRVRPLVILVKTWARHHDINDAKSMTLSSYSLTLMVIHFLQCGVLPAVLPCLQKMYREKFSPDQKLSYLCTVGAISTFKSENNLSLGELLLRFLNYYSTFNFAVNAISVRLGSTITAESCRHAQAPKNDPSQWKYICIEEPYDQTNTARSVYEPRKFQRILDVFRRSANRLAETKVLASIFDPIP